MTSSRPRRSSLVWSTEGTPSPRAREVVDLRVINGPKREQVNLSRRMPVYLLYTTVVVKKSGEVLVFDDIYGHDAHLEDLLEGGYPYLS